MATNSATSAPASTTEDGVPSTTVEKICGLSRDVALTIVKGDGWLTAPQPTDEATGEVLVEQLRYVEISIDEDGNVSVKKHNHDSQPKNAILVEKFSSSEIAELLAADVWTQKQFAAICFSVLCNKGPIETFAKIIAKFGGKFPASITEVDCAFIAHMAWLIDNRLNADGIMADEVVKTIFSILGWSEPVKLSFIANLSLESFYDPENKLKNEYLATYQKVFLTGDVPQECNRALLVQHIRSDLERCEAIVAMLA
jgi:hypothetical protein